MNLTGAVIPILGIQWYALITGQLDARPLQVSILFVVIVMMSRSQAREFCLTSSIIIGINCLLVVAGISEGTSVPIMVAGALAGGGVASIAAVIIAAMERKPKP